MLSFDSSYLSKDWMMAKVLLNIRGFGQYGLYYLEMLTGRWESSCHGRGSESRPS